MKEIWKYIKGFEEYYQISNVAKIKSNDRWVKHNVAPKIFKKGKMFIPFLSTSGYMMINLSKNGKNGCYSIHRLLATVFIENPENKKCVNHINGIKTDNRIENLEWCTPKENSIHAIRTGLLVQPILFGTDNPRARQVIQKDLSGSEIKRWNFMNETKKDGFTPSGVSACCRGIKKKHKNFVWEYAN